MRTLRCFLVLACLAASCSLPDYQFLRQTVASCSDGLSNGSETDEDCGGDRCGPCKTGRSCGQDQDCEGVSCVARRCQAAHCIDQGLSDDETDVDCGGTSCVKCGVNQRCHLSSDCASNACSEGRCIATGCDDEVTNRSETDLNCGGGTCPPCGFSKRCLSSGDCESGICLSEQCSTESCADGLKSPDESGRDCGGACAAKCPSGEGCVANSDCQSGACSAGRCLGSCSSGALEESGGGRFPGCEPVGSGGSGASSAAPGSAGSSGREPSGGESNTSGSGGGGATVGGTDGVSGAPGGAGGESGKSEGGSSSAGTTASGGSASGNAGTAGNGGSAGSTCPGCAVLSVPLAAPDDRGNFLITLPSAMDFSHATIRFRIFKQAGTGGQIKGYVQHGGSPDFAQLFQLNYPQLSSISGWFELIWDVGAQPANYDKTIVGRVGIQIIGLGSSSWTNPTIVYVDSISVEGPSVGPWLFDDASSVAPEANIGAPPNVLWRNAGDNPAQGAAVSWFSM